MKHEIEESTRAIVRSEITSARRKFNLSRKDAESFVRRNLGTCDVHEALMVAIADDIAEQKEYERDLKEFNKDNA